MNSRIINALFFVSGAATAALPFVFYHRKKMREIMDDAQKCINQNTQEVGRLNSIIGKQKREIESLTGDSIPIVERTETFPIQRVRYEYGLPDSDEEVEDGQEFDETHGNEKDVEHDSVPDDIDFEASIKNFLGIIEEEEYSPIEAYTQIYLKFDAKSQTYVLEDGAVLNYAIVCQYLGSDLVQKIAATYNKNPLLYASKTFHVRNSNFRSDYIINLA